MSHNRKAHNDLLDFNLLIDSLGILPFAVLLFDWNEPLTSIANDGGGIINHKYLSPVCQAQQTSIGLAMYFNFMELDPFPTIMVM